MILPLRIGFISGKRSISGSAISVMGKVSDCTPRASITSRACVQRFLARGFVGHAHGQHILRSKRFGSQVAGERRIKPAGQADHRLAESPVRVISLWIKPVRMLRARPVLRLGRSSHPFHFPRRLCSGCGSFRAAPARCAHRAAAAGERGCGAADSSQFSARVSASGDRAAVPTSSPLGSYTVEPPQKFSPSSYPTRLAWATKEVNRLA